MGTTYQSLLDQFYEVRNEQYRSDPERREAIEKQIEYTLQTLLEKLRDRFEG